MRGRWQFSLAQLLVVITALALGLGAGLHVLASARQLSLSASEWWGLGMFGLLGVVIVFGILLARGGGT